MVKVCSRICVLRFQLLLIFLLTILTACSTIKPNTCSPDLTLEENETLKYFRANSLEIDSLINKKFRELNINNDFDHGIKIGGFSFVNYMPASKLNSSFGRLERGSKVFYTMANELELKKTEAYIAEHFYDIRAVINDVLGKYLEKGGHKNVYSVSAFTIYDTSSYETSLKSRSALPYCCQECVKPVCVGSICGTVFCCEIACGCCRNWSVSFSGVHRE